MPKAITVFILLFQFISAQKIDFQWAKHFECDDLDAGNAVTVDLNGDVYTVGDFQGKGDFNPSSDVFNLPSGGSGVFISKLGKKGEFKWAKCFTGTSTYNHCKSVAIDPLGNVYLTGEFRFTMDFSPGFGNNKLNTGGEAPNIYVTKLDNSGNLVWTKQIGNSLDISSNSVATDAAGNIYFTGFFSGTLDFDPGPGISELVAAKYGSIYVVKMSTAGKLVWAKQFRGTSGNYGWCVDVDRYGNVYTSGPFCGRIDFDPGSGVYNMTDQSGCIETSSFICKLDSSGNFIWARQILKTGLAPLTLDNEGNAYFCGSFRGNVDFDPGPDSNLVSATSPTNFNGFICKLNSSGKYEWVKTLSSVSTGTPSSICSSICIDKSGHIFFTGMFNGTTDFDPGPGSYTLSSTKGIFIAGLDSLGNFWFAKNINGIIRTGFSGRTIATDQFNNIYCTGVFGNTPDGGQDSINIHSPNNYSTFIMKFGPTILDTASATTIITIPKFVIYPNPTNGIVKITFAEKCENIKIVDIAGRLIYDNSEVTQNEISFDITEYPTGVYLCSITTNKKTHSYKILKFSD